ncbi:hypothetical protein [Roseomonas sp. KE2513]|uniref:hypothetical protein n=1 Tax=Roseomonas sp. KE2513 TaxID=2479202 RepID=UPI0018DEF53B|nr:hypothetical protein [Roseomonas sp. KE2513]
MRLWPEPSGLAPSAVRPVVRGVPLAVPLLPQRLGVLLLDAVLLAFALLQLSPFLAAFHQTADDNFWQYAVLSNAGRPEALGEAIHQLAKAQGRIGLYPAMPLVMLGAMLPEYAWGRVLVVGLFGGLMLAFGHLLARRLGVPLTRAGLLMALCLAPVAAHHMPPNAYPLMLTLPLAALVGLHIWMGEVRARSGMALLAGAGGLAALMLMLEYSLVAGAGLAALVVLSAPEGQRWRAVRLHAPPMLLAALAYVAYRMVHPSAYGGNMMAWPGLWNVVRLQALHAFHGTSLPVLGAPWRGFSALGRRDMAMAVGVLACGTWLAWRLLPALAARLTAGLAVRVVLACLAWAWLNTLPHALTEKYQSWCRAGDCTYVDSRIAALGVGAAAAVGLAALLRAVWARPGARRAVSLLCALGVGGLGTFSFLQNRLAAREMFVRERPFALLREAACQPSEGLGTNAVAMAMLGREIWWHRPPATVLPPEVYLAAYRDGLAAFGLACRPMPFAPPARSVEFLGWSGAEERGRWTVGPGGLLVLAGQEGSRGMVLTLAAYVPTAGGAQRVVARLGDGTACEMRLGSEPLDLLVPWDEGALGWVGSGGREAVLVLETPDAVSPLTAGVSEDRRPLGVLLSAVRSWQAEGAVPRGLDMRECARAGGTARPG